MMHTKHAILLDRGRKAGLRTAELYQAMSADRTREITPQGQTDGNGYVSGYDSNGRPVFTPGLPPRS